VAISNGGTIKTDAELTLRTGISGAGELRKIGLARLVLSSAATFTGTVSIDEGGLVLAAPDALSAAAGVEFDGPGTLELSVSSELQRLRSGTAPGRVNLGAFALTLQTPPVTGSNFSGVVEGTGKLIKAGPGSLLVSGGASTFSGGLEIRAGLVASPDIANSGQPSSLGGGGAITLGDDTTPGILQFTGTTGASNRPIILEGEGGTLLVSSVAGALALSGGISGSGDLTKSGAGRLTLAGTSPLTGRLQVGQGTLRLDGTLSAGPGSLNINPGATLTGGGVANRPVSIQGTFAPIGTFSTGPLVLQSNSTFALNFASPSSFDRVSATGSVTLTGTVNLSLAVQYDPTDFVDSFVVLLNDGADAITGRMTLAGNLLDAGERFIAGGQEWEIRYNGGDGNDLALLAVPEPTSTACLLVAGGLLAHARRRGRARASELPSRWATAADQQGRRAKPCERERRRLGDGRDREVVEVGIQRASVVAVPNAKERAGRRSGIVEGNRPAQRRRAGAAGNAGRQIEPIGGKIAVRIDVKAAERQRVDLANRRSAGGQPGAGDHAAIFHKAKLPSRRRAACHGEVQIDEIPGIKKVPDSRGKETQPHRGVAGGPGVEADVDRKGEALRRDDRPAEHPGEIDSRCGRKAASSVRVPIRLPADSARNNRPLRVRVFGKEARLRRRLSRRGTAYRIVIEILEVRQSSRPHRDRREQCS
jgi:autotransporter-associated beta strand protein